MLVKWIRSKAQGQLTVESRGRQDRRAIGQLCKNDKPKDDLGVIQCKVNLLPPLYGYSKLLVFHRVPKQAQEPIFQKI